MVAQDVSVALLAARSSGLPLSVRSGGHSYTCTSLRAGALLLDTRSLNTVSLVPDTDSPTGLTALLGTGATWAQVQAVLPTSQYRQAPSDRHTRQLFILSRR